MHSSVFSTDMITWLALSLPQWVLSMSGTPQTVCGDIGQGANAALTETTMFLQTNHELEHNQPQHVGILETCPPDKFQSSLAWMLENNLFLESNITEAAQTRYLELAEQQHCELGPEWYVSQKPLVINVGDGSTATRWLDQVMQDLGFNTHHYSSGQNQSLNGHKGIPIFSRTSSVDMFDYISDTPVSSLTWQLLQSHPKALFLMTMRDPVEWLDSRDHHHFLDYDLTQGLPCGKSSLRVASNQPAQTYVAYSAWAKCIIPEDRFLGAVNVFADENNDDKFVEKLIHLLEMHGLQKSGWEERTARVRADFSRAP